MFLLKGHRSVCNFKKSGANYTCCCPFHHEKTPSFSVTPAKQMFYCFGCKEHGNVIDFIMKLKNLSFPEAVEEIAQNAGLTVEYDTTNTRSKEEVDLQKSITTSWTDVRPYILRY